MGVIAELASFVTGARASGLPETERERLRLHLADTVVAALGGARIAEGKALHRFGAPSALAGRIGRRAAAARLTEIDDIHLPSCVTPSAGVVPAALELAASLQNFDPEEVASAIWAGSEIATRIGLAVGGPQILYRGIWPSYLAAPVAAAAVAARLSGLDDVRAGHALSLSFMLLAGGAGRIHGAPSGRWFIYASAVANGVAAAEAARAGYRGDPALLDGNWLADTHGIALACDRLTANLGAKDPGAKDPGAKDPGATSVYGALSLKPFCSAKQGIAAVEAFRAILGDGVRGEAITKVRVRVPSAYAGMIARRVEPGARQSTIASVAHQIARAALDPDRLYDIDRTAPVVDAGVADLAARVEVVADAALETFYPQHWPAEVEVEAGGKFHRRRVVEAAGDPERPLGRAAIDDKAHKVLDPLMGAGCAGEWLALSHDALTDAKALERLAEAFASADDGMG